MPSSWVTSWVFVAATAISVASSDVATDANSASDDSVDAAQLTTLSHRPIGEAASLLATYTGQAATNLKGGFQYGREYAGRILVQGRFDLQRTLALGGQITVFLTNRHGRELSATAIGNNTSVQEVYGPQETGLALVAYQQEYLDGRLELEAGRIVANTAFLDSPSYCHFQSNSVCPCPTFIFKTSNFTFFPAPSWGAHIKAWTNSRWYVHGGVYEVNPEKKRPSANGFDWSTRSATGVIVPFEIGYQTSGKEDRLPRHYRLGGWRDTGDYSDPSRDEAGDLAIFSGSPRAIRAGRAGLFVQLEQTIRRDAFSDRSLTIFGVAMAGTSGRVVEDRFLEIGLVQAGTFRGRDDDTFGFVFNEQRFSRWALENGRAARAASGGVHRPPRNQMMFELAYGAQLTPRVRISPNIQYIAHPDQMADPFQAKDTPDALIIGLKFTVDAPIPLPPRMRRTRSWRG